MRGGWRRDLGVCFSAGEGGGIVGRGFGDGVWGRGVRDGFWMSERGLFGKGVLGVCEGEVFWW